MRKTTTKVLALILTLVMVLGFAPTTAFAQENLPAPAGQVYEEKPASLEEKENEKNIEEITVPVSVGDNKLAAAGQCGANVYWTFDEETGALTISGEGDMWENGCFTYNDSIKTVKIESGVTSISEYAFEYCSSLTSIEIPDSVTSIGDCAFQLCSSLTSIEIPDSVTSIGGRAFFGCSSLKIVTIGNNVTSIEAYAFEDCTGVEELYFNAQRCVDGVDMFDIQCMPNLKKVFLGEMIEIIPGGAFYGLEHLSSITIPENVVSIGDFAFEDCKGLKSLIYNAKNCEFIGYSEHSNSYCFSNCSNLEVITIGENVESIPDKAFAGLMGLKTMYYNAKKCVAVGNNVFGAWINDNECINFEEVIFGENVESIPDRAFEDTYIKKIELSNSIKEIGNNAFARSSLKSLDIPDSNINIGERAFANCDSLISVNTGDGITSINNETFSGCENLSNLILGCNVKRIAPRAFEGCKSLSEIIIPDNVLSIDERAFVECYGVRNVSIGSGLNDILFLNFFGVYDESINVRFKGSYTELRTLSKEYEFCFISGIINAICTETINIGKCGEKAYSRFDLNDTTGTLYVYGSGETYVYDYFDDNCEWIPNVARYFEDEVKNIVIGDDITVIGAEQFRYLKNLQSVSIGKGVKSIMAYSFNDVGLREITIPKNVEYIADKSIGFDFIEKNVPLRKVEGFKIYCYKGTEGERYAKEYGFDYQLLDCISTVLLSFDPNGGTVDTASIEVESGSTIPSMPSATKTGYKFDGWFTDKTGGTKVDTTTVINENLTVYAHWTAIKYTVKFYDDAVLLGSKQFTYDHTDALSYSNSVPTKEGYDFLGWANTKDSVVYFANGTQAKNLASTDGAVVVFYAIWEEVIPEQQTVIDQTTGIEMNIVNGTYTGDVTMQVEEVLSGSSFVLAGKVENASSTKIFSIKTFVDGQEVQPNGYVTVKIPVPAGFNASRCKIYYLDVANDTTVEMPVTVEGNYLVFKTNHFSDWAVVETKASVKSVSIGDISLQYKSSATLTPHITADDGASYTVTYSSSNPSVVSVDQSGKVTSQKQAGFNQGSATITCTVTDSNGNAVQDTCKVSVQYAWWQWLIKILLFGWIWY